MSQSALDKLREKLHKLEPTPQEKEASLDDIFAKIDPQGHQFAKASVPKIEKPDPSISGWEIYSTFGGGSIIVEDRDTSLPLIISDESLYKSLVGFYSIDSPTSPLRSRRIG